jgi:hypothetical protein
MIGAWEAGPAKGCGEIQKILQKTVSSKWRVRSAEELMHIDGW